MGKVNFLSEDIISKISAGEVVEGPFSVLKELVENSIDANSKKIEIKIEKSGKKLISIKDDGEGIEPDDIEKVFERHATSKIKNKEDLYKISTMGFRGEALYSISAVSDVILKSKVRNYLTGREIHVRGGEKLTIKEIGIPDGTIVEVRELFFNTPARRKFLKSDITEYRKILNTFFPYTISYPEIKFIFESDGEKIIETIPSDTHLKRLCEIFNFEEKNLIYYIKEYSEFKIEVIFGDMNLKRPRKDIQFVFINRRPVYNYAILSTINNFYHSFFSSDYFPVFVVLLNLPFENVDVNVHPSKREVKIRNENEICHKIIQILEEIFKKGLPKQVKIEEYPEEIKEKKLEEKIKENGENFVIQRIFEEEKGLKEKLKNSIFIGIFKNKYLIFESSFSILILDQHAVCERINYERFLNEYENGEILVQRILTPIIINLTIEEMDIWEKGEKILEKFGFLTTRWSENKIAVHGYPQFIKDPEFSIRSILSEKDIKKWDKQTIAKKACRISIMSGDKIEEKQVHYLIEKLLECKNPFVCPHGRPIVIEISEKFLDKEFSR